MDFGEVCKRKSLLTSCSPNDETKLRKYPRDPNRTGSVGDFRKHGCLPHEHERFPGVRGGRAFVSHAAGIDLFILQGTPQSSIHVHRPFLGHFPIRPPDKSARTHLKLLSQSGHVTHKVPALYNNEPRTAQTPIGVDSVNNPWVVQWGRNSLTARRGMDRIEFERGLLQGAGTHCFL